MALKSRRSTSPPTQCTPHISRPAMQRAGGASAAAAVAATAAAPSAHALADPLGATQSEASADVEELYGPLPPFTAPKVARSHSETAAPPLPDRQPGQPPPPPEDAPKQPPKQQRPPAAAAAPPKPQPQPQAKPQPQPAKPPPPRQQPAPKPAAGGRGAKPPPGEHTFPYEELKSELRSHVVALVCDHACSQKALHVQVRCISVTLRHLTLLPPPIACTFPQACGRTAAST